LSAPGVEEFFPKQDRRGLLNPNQMRQTLGRSKHWQLSEPEKGKPKPGILAGYKPGVAGQSDLKRKPDQ
jgi:hypothetical protein